MGFKWRSPICWDDGKKWDDGHQFDMRPPHEPPPSSDPDWLLAKKHINKRLKMLRARLETPGRPHSETERDRGAIQELKGVLKFRDHE